MSFNDYQDISRCFATASTINIVERDKPHLEAPLEFKNRISTQLHNDLINAYSSTEFLNKANPKTEYDLALLILKDMDEKLENHVEELAKLAHHYNFLSIEINLGLAAVALEHFREKGFLEYTSYRTDGYNNSVVFRTDLAKD